MKAHAVSVFTFPVNFVKARAKGGIISRAMRRRCGWVAGLACALQLGASAHAQIQTAGTLFVNLDATGLAAGTVTDITNSGSLGGLFESRNSSGAAANGSIIVSSNGVSGINLSASFVMQLRSGTNGALIPPPGGIIGNNATTTIEVWALNPSVVADECMVSWGRRGFAGQNMAFGYGNDANLGAVTHTTAPDLAWDPLGGTPLSTYWHHLVYTYNGTAESVFVDGVLVNSKVGAVNIATNAGIMLGAQWTNSAGADIVAAGPPLATLTIGRVRIHDGALTPSQILNNYNVEKSVFVASPTVPQFLSHSPVHRYSFNEPDTNDATGLVLHDSIASANGVGRGTNTQTVPRISHGRLVLPASETGTRTGPQQQSAYGDLPNGLLSVNSTNNGGTGEFSIELWYRETGGVANARLFDMGSCGTLGSPGVEVFDVGGRPSTDTALDYFFYSSTLNTAGANLNARRLSIQNKDPLPSAPTNSVVSSSDTFSMLTHQMDRHVVVTWKESTGAIIAYENGFRVASVTTSNAMSQINDVNVWLGRSMLTDAGFAGEYDEVRFYTNVLTPAEIIGDFQVGADTVNLAEQAAAIIAQPKSATIFQGLRVSFEILASGSPAPAYQWRRNGSPIASATNNTYAIAAVSAANNGDVYTCVVSNNTASATNEVISSAVSLTVIPNQSQPFQILHETRDGTRDNYNTSASGNVGGLFKTGTNTVAVTHLGFYDMNNDGLNRDHHVGIFSSSGLTLIASVDVPPGTDSYLTNGYRYTALSTPLFLAPNTTYILIGEVFNGDGDGWPDVFAPGFWNPYFVGSNDGSTRQARFTGSTFGANPSSTSSLNSSYGAPNLASLPIGPAIALIADTAITNYSGLTLSLPAFINGEPPVSVQWYKAPSTLLPGQTNVNLTIPALALSDAGDYYVIANNTSGPSQSGLVTLTVLPGVPVTIAQSPTNTTVPEGFPVSLSVTPAGTPPFVYQWVRNGSPVSGANSNSFDIPAATLAMSGDTFSCVISNVADSIAYSATSAVAVLTVVPNKAQPIQFLNETRDGNRDDYTGNVGGNFLVGSTDALVTHLGYYDVDGDGLQRDHHVGIFTPAGVLLAQVVVPFGTDAFLTNGYRWVALDPPFVLTNNTSYYLGAEVFSFDGDGWPDIFVPDNWNPYYVGANPGSTRIARFAAGAWPVAPVSGTAQNSRYAPGNLAVLPIGLPMTSIQPSAATAYTGDSVMFSAVVNGEAPLTVQWYKSPGILLAGQTATTLTLANLTVGDSGDYYIAGFNAAGSNSTSMVHLTVLNQTPPIITQLPVSQTVYVHQQTTFSVEAVGQQPLGYQWRLNNADIAGATSSSYTALNSSPETAGNYSVVVSNALGSTNSTAATLTVLPAPDGYPTAVLDATPLVYYRFDDVGGSSLIATNLGSLGAAYNGQYEGDFYEDSGPQPPGFPVFESNNVAFANQTLAAGGVRIPALVLDTNSSPHSTFVAWVYKEFAQNPFNGIIFSRSAAGQSCGFGTKLVGGNDEITYTWNDLYYQTNTGLAVPNYQWTFVALVIEPSRATIYLQDGNSMQTFTNITPHASRPILDPSYVGSDAFAGIRRWFGKIDEPMIFNRSLSPAEVTALYTAAIQPQVKVQITASGHSITLTWLTGTLQQADSAEGPYMDVNSAASPYTINATEAKKFFRVKVSGP